MVVLTPYERGHAAGERDAGDRYTGGQGSGYQTDDDRDAYRAGYEAAWDEWEAREVLKLADRMMAEMCSAKGGLR